MKSSHSSRRSAGLSTILCMAKGRTEPTGHGTRAMGTHRAGGRITPLSRARSVSTQQREHAGGTGDFVCLRRGNKKLFFRFFSFLFLSTKLQLFSKHRKSQRFPSSPKGGLLSASFQGAASFLFAFLGCFFFFFSTLCLFSNLSESANISELCVVVVVVFLPIRSSAGFERGGGSARGPGRLRAAGLDHSAGCRARRAEPALKLPL